jgi:hypothetical protein
LAPRAGLESAFAKATAGQASNPPVNSGTAGPEAEQNHALTAPSEKASIKSASFFVPASAFAGLQAADLHSAHRAISSGAGREGNSLMQFSTGEQAAIKAAMTVGTIYLMSKKHAKRPRAATITLWVMNGIMARVVAHNYRVDRR